MPMGRTILPSIFRVNRKDVTRLRLSVRTSRCGSSPAVVCTPAPLQLAGMTGSNKYDALEPPAYTVLVPEL